MIVIMADKFEQCVCIKFLLKAQQLQFTVKYAHSHFSQENNMLFIPPPPLTPCDFALFSKRKLKLKGCHFEILDGSQMELQAVVNGFRKMTSTVHLGLERGGGITVYIPKGTMATKFKCGKPVLFFRINLELSNTTIYILKGTHLAADLISDMLTGSLINHAGQTSLPLPGNTDTELGDRSPLGFDAGISLVGKGMLLKIVQHTVISV